MRSLVIYASRTGNTRTIAEAVGRGLEARGTTRVVSIDEVPAVSPDGVDLVVVGAPTEKHGVYEPMTRWLDRLPANALAGVRVAVFDTRLWWPKRLSGAASEAIAERLGHQGAHSVAPPMSFIVSMKPTLQPGEAERATAWGTSLADAVEAGEPATAR